MFVFTRNKPIVQVDCAYKPIRPLNPLSRFLIYLLLISPVCACSAKGMTPEVGENIKDYTAILCAPLSNSSLEENVPTLASTYYLFRHIALPPHDVQVQLNRFYATGKSEMDSQIFDSPTRLRLGFHDLNEPGFVKIASVLRTPTKASKKQSLRFSDSCQIKSALLENEELSRHAQGAFYLLASRKSFIAIRQGSYNPEPSLPVKFKLLNPRTQQIEEATIPLQQIIGGDFYSAPSSLTEQLVNKVKSLAGVGDNNDSAQWMINKKVKPPISPDYPYFTLTKQSEGETVEGEILSVEFTPE